MQLADAQDSEERIESELQLNLHVLLFYDDGVKT